LTRTTTITCILFWLTTIQLVLGLVCAGYDGNIALPGLAQIFPVTVIGLAGLGAHFCLTRALSLAPASIVTPMDFLRLPLIGLVGAAFYAEPLDIWVFVGGAVIFAANWLNIRTESTRPRAVVPDAA
jgi:drug/metabolite transporter (DMT)-like permease